MTATPYNAFAATRADPSLATRTRPLPTPLVLVDGRLRDDLRVERLHITGDERIERRTADLVLAPAPAVGAAGSGIDNSPDALMPGAAVVVAQPLVLVGGEAALLPLLSGRLEPAATSRSATASRRSATAVCDAAAAMTRTIGLDVQPETIGEALTRIEQAASIRFNRRLVPPVVFAQPAPPLTRRATIGSMLDAVLAEAGLLARRAWPEPGRTMPITFVLHAVGSPLPVDAADLVDGSAAIVAWQSRAAQPTPIKLIATAAGEQVEATVELQPGWSADAEQRADDQYRKTTSDDFRSVANVFRLWVLNEDGAFAGDAFDLDGLFGGSEPLGASGEGPPDASLDPPLDTPVPVGRCLTRDASGRRIEPVVETSVDDGQTWREYGGRANVLADRAGVYLDDDALGGDWLAAVRAGQGRVRITGTLRCPRPRHIVRWKGNALAGPFAIRRIDAGDRFAVRRVDPSSRFHLQVRSGQHAADEADGSAAFEAWVVRQAAAASVGADARLTLQLRGVRPGLAIGDRLELAEASGDPIDVDLRVAAVTFDWPEQRTVITCVEGAGP